jgi:hypothetical protein
MFSTGWNNYGFPTSILGLGASTLLGVNLVTFGECLFWTIFKNILFLRWKKSLKNSHDLKKMLHKLLGWKQITQNMLCF